MDTKSTTPPGLRPFDLTLALAGGETVTRDGRKVPFVTLKEAK